MSTKYTRITVSPDIGEQLQVGAKAPFVVNLSQSISGVTIEELTKVSSEVKKDALSASNSAKAAKTSETNAKLSETNASTSETNVKASENESKKQADLATEQATIATNKALEAANQANLAKDMADEATNQANLSKISADASKESADTSSSSAMEATNQANLAKDSADEATTQAGIATTKAEESTISAGNSSTSATEAKASADAAKISETNASGSATEAASILDELKNHSYDKPTVDSKLEDVKNNSYDKSVVDSKLSDKVDKSGDIMSGTLETTTKVLTKSANGEHSLGLISSNSGSANIEKVQGVDTYLIRVPQKTGTMLLEGDFGLGAGPTSGNISPPFPENANNASNAGFYAGGGTNAINYYDNYAPLWAGVRQGGDGSGTIVQFQFSADGRKLAARVRDRNTWSGWFDLPTKHRTDSQFFEGQLISYQGLYSFDKNKPTNYFGMKRAVGGDPYGFFLAYENQGHTINFPRSMGGDILLTNTGNAPNTGDNRVLLFRAIKAEQAAYIEYQKPDGSQRWRVGSMGNNTNIALTTGSGGALVLDAEGCLVNGRNTILQGDFGIGGLTPLMGNNDLKTSQTSSMFRMGGGTDSNIFTNHGCGIHFAYSPTIRSGMFVNASTGVTYSYTSDERDANGIVRTRIIYSTVNTTVDSNGFIKRASPVIKIRGDGSFELNEESEGANVVRLGLGHYRVTGVYGFNSDNAWGIDGGISIPKDHNDQPLIWLEPEVNPDGSVDIYTFHRENHIPENIRAIRERRLARMGGEYTAKVDGEPCDIPAGTFVDLRVEMPEDSIYATKQKEIEDNLRKYEKYQKPIDEAWENKPEYISDAMDKFLNI